MSQVRILSPRPFSPWGNALNLRSKLARMRTKFERTTKCRASRQSLSPSFRRRKLATWHSPDGSGQSCLPDHFLSENGLRMRTKFERTRSAVHHAPSPSQMRSSISANEHSVCRARAAHDSINKKSGGGFLLIRTE